MQRRTPATRPSRSAPSANSANSATSATSAAKRSAKAAAKPPTRTVAKALPAKSAAKRATTPAAAPSKPKVAAQKTPAPVAAAAQVSANGETTAAASTAPKTYPPASVRPHFGANGFISTVPVRTLIPSPPFKLGEKAVHPSHGVGEVTAIEQRDIGGSKQEFYVLRILDNGMKVMVPTSAATQVGLRYIMSEKDANSILTTMRAREVAVDVQPWSRRFRVYTEMIKSGLPEEVAKVLRDMNRLKFDKDLSFGERRLLDQAKSLLLKELAFAKKKSEADMAEEIRLIFSA
jgi:CarD family transcriptional regulator